MGKTRLATELAHQISEDYADGVYFLDLAPLTDSHSLIPLMIEVFQLSASAQTPMQPILNFCRDKSQLLLFDNFETVLAGADYLIQILENAEHVKIIVTTREQLGIPHETIFRLNPLKHEAENLFIEMAQRRRPDFEVTEQNAPFITQVCNLVDGLPLGIILAASWVDALLVEENAEEIKTNLNFLEDELASLPERQRSIRVVMEQTWERMSSKEKQHFARLSVFRGGFNRHTAQAITETDLQTLRELLSRALIERTRTGRFIIHAIILEFAKEKFTQHETAPDTYDKHVHYFHHFVKE